MSKWIRRLVSSAALVTVIGAIFLVGKPHPLSGQQIPSSSYPGCGCFTCGSNNPMIPNYILFPDRKENCVGIVAADACARYLVATPGKSSDAFCAEIKRTGKFTSFKDSCPVYANACDPDKKEPPPEPKSEKPDDPNPTPESPVPDSSTASAAQTGNELIEVRIRCPISAKTVGINWKNHLDGSFQDTGGQGGTLDFNYAGGSNEVSVPFFQATRSGQKINCSYRMLDGGSILSALYTYKVKREIVGCFSAPQGMTCRVKP